MSITYERKIQVIPPKINIHTAKKQEVKRIHVAAYCRVSTAQEDQETSYEAQVAYFTKLITENPSWQLAGIYADDGISGTDMKKRDNFNAMMERCLQKNGDIDLILTKSISRFARNTVDCLSCIRKLKERNIAIYFEKEHINTLESTGELLITILSSQAQEESRNISENVKWGLKRKYEKGEMLVRRMFGYGKGTDGQMYIIPEEAEVVRLIYGKYLEGESLNGIARLLKEKGIKTIRGNTQWNVNSIRTILINEKYIGDAMAQKTFTTDYLTKARKENQGELQKYYVENAHEAIIPREVFYKVQEELHQRANIYKKSSKQEKEAKGKHSGKYALSKITICKECGCEYRRQIWSKYGEKKAVWRCENRLRNGTRYCKDSPTIEESVLHRAVLHAINQVLENKDEFVQTLRKNVVTALTHGTEDSEYAKEKKKLQKAMAELIQQQAQKNGDKTAFEERCQAITAQIEALEMEQIKAACIGEKSRKMEDIKGFLDKIDCVLTEYDDKLVRQLIQNIKVVNTRKIEVVFKSGITVEEMLPEYY
ncbi:recombinase family protein [Anaerotignum lactatifermentans]|uniref:Site-specific DNA recombinase n=2 Tax=Anaerotignum lactatifermentans TaxID=160404 RepID=A0A1M6ZSW2_9FIRM|nr:recombinase family protein [Anaerotignum lactatifermentans]SHL33577.1 site-specific DNA recombinase [[Clostridium] lactatifermentans DSM 14214] [Anaerotignum lactatifermentans DSM 14214]